MGQAGQDELYRQASEGFGAPLKRLAGAYEADQDKRRDLVQDIQFQLWRSFERFDSRCSLRTWVYRVAHHVTVSHVMRERRTFTTLVTLEELESFPDAAGDAYSGVDHRINLERLSRLIQKLKPIDRQVIVSYLEELDAGAIGEITGLSPARRCESSSDQEHFNEAVLEGRKGCWIAPKTTTRGRFGKTKGRRERI